MNKKYKLLPLTVMLLAGAITVASTYALHYETKTALWLTVLILILFFIIGTVFQKVLLKFEAQIAEEEAKRLEEEGKVVEKEGAASESGEGEASDGGVKPTGNV